MARRFFPGLFEPYFIPRRGRKAKRVSVKNIKVISGGNLAPLQVGDPRAVSGNLPRPGYSDLSISIGDKLDERGLQNNYKNLSIVGKIHEIFYLSNGALNDNDPRVIDDVIDMLQNPDDVGEYVEEYLVNEQDERILRDLVDSYTRSR